MRFIELVTVTITWVDDRPMLIVNCIPWSTKNYQIIQLQPTFGSNETNNPNQFQRTTAKINTSQSLASLSMQLYPDVTVGFLIWLVLKTSPEDTRQYPGLVGNKWKKNPPSNDWWQPLSNAINHH